MFDKPVLKDKAMCLKARSRARQCVWRSDQEPGFVSRGAPKSKAMYMERGLSGEASFHKPVLKSQAMCLKARSKTRQYDWSGLQKQSSVYERPSGEPGNVFNLVLQGVGLVLQASLKDKAVLYNQALKISFAMRACECMVWYNKIR